jgi:hypothetical protein
VAVDQSLVVRPEGLEVGVVEEDVLPGEVGGGAVGGGPLST